MFDNYCFCLLEYWHFRSLLTCYKISSYVFYDPQKYDVDFDNFLVLNEWIYTAMLKILKQNKTDDINLFSEAFRTKFV